MKLYQQLDALCSAEDSLSLISTEPPQDAVVGRTGTLRFASYFFCRSSGTPMQFLINIDIMCKELCSICSSTKALCSCKIGDVALRFEAARYK